jgi:hypothetical protein
VPTNTPPTSTDDVASVPEGSSVIIDVLFNDNDTDGTIVVGSLLITVGPINGTAVANTSTGTITYTPNQNYSGTDTLQYQICDDGGDCSTASVSITITPVNDPPVAVDDNLTLAEDSPSTLNVLANDTDVDSPSLSISAVGNPANGSVVNNTSSLFYTPAQDFFGSDVFTYTITDGTLGDTATVSLTVTPVNDAPVANPDSASTAEDTREVINVRQNDVDVENDRLTIIAVTSPSNGTATTNGNIVIYTPNLNFDGTDIFTYTLSDGLLTDTTTVSVTIIPINDPPQANPDTYTTPANTPLTVAAPGVLANDTDVDSSALRVALISGPSSGTLVLNADGSFVFTPAPGFTGTVTFDYRVFDSRDDSNTVTVTIIVG